MTDDRIKPIETMLGLPGWCISSVRLRVADMAIELLAIRLSVIH